jgi:DNA ligase-4
VERRNDALEALDVRIITGGVGGGAMASDKAAALKQELAALVAAHGGQHSEGVTHIIAAPEARNGVRFKAVEKQGGMDILTPDWLRECAEAGRVIPPRPRHRLYLSRCTVDQMEGGMDDFGDEHNADVTVEDVAALLKGHRMTTMLESEAGQAAAEVGLS